MKKNLSTLINSILFGAALVIGLTVTSAAGMWNDPISSPIGGNLSIPVHTGSVSQVKTGGLAVNTFFAQGNAEFDQQVFFRKPIFGGIPSGPAPLAIGGTDSTGATAFVDTSVAGLVTAQGTLGADELSNTITDRLCADTQGHVVLCPLAPPNVMISAQYGPSFTGVTGIAGFTFQGPVQHNAQGYHDAFTGPITVTLDGQAPFFDGVGISLEKNSQLVACYAVTSGNYKVPFSFPSTSYEKTDTIGIYLISGNSGCH